MKELKSKYFQNPRLLNVAIFSDISRRSTDARILFLIKSCKTGHAPTKNYVKCL